jgi:hypothetical protein
MALREVTRPDHQTLVCRSLLEEFGDRFDRSVIEQVAADAVAALRDSRIQDYIPILATRRARARLRAQMEANVFVGLPSPGVEPRSAETG